MKKLLLAFACAGALAAFDAQAAEPVGPETCRSCHPRAYEQWKQSRHARSGEALPEAQRAQASCRTCHAPSEAGGAEGQGAVSCETCHGGGRYYAKSHVMKDEELSRLVGLEVPTEQTCRQCHDERAPTVRAFHFVERQARIDHGRAAKQGPAQVKAPEAKSKAAPSHR